MNTKGNNKEETIEESPQGQQVIFQLIKVFCILKYYKNYPNYQHGFNFFLKLNASLLFMLTICNSEDHFC